MHRFISKSVLAFGKDENDAMTVEFVVMLPLLLFWFIGSIVFYVGFKAKSLAATTVSTVADITSRYKTMGPAEFNQLVQLQTSLLSRYPDQGLRISNIEYDLQTDKYFVRWSQASGTGILPLVDKTIPMAIVPAMYDSETVVLVELSFVYIPMVDWVGINPKLMQANVAISPRFEPFVTWVP